ncbi:nuclease-related domain-containing protein [Flavobacterium sp.]|uniref:nuclease-related domain-containing protein n=1 Tax=Flavobacterium sp. TaxID=239 RepID=UPI003750D2EC
MEFIIILISIIILGFLIKKSVNHSESNENRYLNRNSIKEDLGSKRGTRSERELVSKLLQYGIPSQTIFHDLYLKKYYGKYSQIDLVVATKVGIFVFEVKEYSGWIFGTGYKPQWSQILNYGRDKYYFYNPILQNAKHIEDLKKQLKQFENIPFYSIIVFYGDCELKEINFVPQNTFVVKSKRVIEVVKKILSESMPANYSNKREIVNLFEQAVKNGENEEVILQHSKNIKNMLGKDRVYN